MIRVLARPYLITLYVIFPIHLSFPMRSRCVVKAIIIEKKQELFYGYLRKFFLFQNYAFYMLLYMHVVPFYHDLFLFFHVSLSIIYLLFKYLEELLVF